MQYDPPPTPSDYPLEHSPAATAPPPSTSSGARSVGPLSYLPPPVARKRRWFAWLWPIAVAALLGATLLYKLVPATPVRWSSSLAGGLFAAICLELLRRGFGLYVELSHNMSAVYGSFAFLLLFLVSIQATWAILLFGCEVAYVAQHYPVLARGLHRHPPMQASWVGLAALAVIADRFLRGQPALSEDELAVRLHVSTAELDRIVHPLLSHDLLRKTAAGEPGYLLAADPHEIQLEQIFQAYDHRARRAVVPLEKNLRERLEAMISGLAAHRSENLDQASLSDLLASDETTLDLAPER